MLFAVGKAALCAEGVSAGGRPGATVPARTPRCAQRSLGESAIPSSADWSQRRWTGGIHRHTSSMRARRRSCVAIRGDSVRPPSRPPPPSFPSCAWECPLGEAALRVEGRPRVGDCAPPFPCRLPRCAKRSFGESAFPSTAWERDEEILSSVALHRKREVAFEGFCFYNSFSLCACISFPPQNHNFTRENTDLQNIAPRTSSLSPIPRPWAEPYHQWKF